MTHTEVLKNKNFRHLATIVRVPFHSSEWRQQHPRVAFWSLNRAFIDATPVEGNWNREEVVEAFTTLIWEIAKDDPALGYSEEDVKWFIGLLDDEPEIYRPVVKMLQAYYSALEPMVTTAEAAEMTGMAESSWRARANSGGIPGAFKKGKTWLLPEAFVKANMPKIFRIRQALKGNNVGVMPDRDVYYVHGTGQGSDEEPMYIDVEVFRTPLSMTEEQWEKGLKRRAKIIRMLGAAGVTDYEVFDGYLHFLND